MHRTKTTWHKNYNINVSKRDPPFCVRKINVTIKHYCYQIFYVKEFDGDIEFVVFISFSHFKNKYIGLNEHYVKNTLHIGDTYL